jgi:Uma2 family endonuclease
MAHAEKLALLSVEEYLAGEERSTTKREYLGGLVYATAGARNEHNLISSNALVAIGGRLRGHACKAYNSDTKIRIRQPNLVRFYYPDLSVVCRPNPRTDTFQDEPVLVVEVLSESTRRVDEGEKREAYLGIPSLQVLLLVEQDICAATLYRRTDGGFGREVLRGADTGVALPELGIDFTLGELYDGL